MRVLVIEDNQRVARLIKDHLSGESFDVDITESGQEGEEKATSDSYDVIILDLMLGECDGLQVCRNLRRRKVGTPILMLTALSTTSDKVQGLEAGGDDYLTKPFEMEELVARVRALTRRGKAEEGLTLSFGDLKMDLKKRLVQRGGRDVHLTTREFSLLEHFMRNPERVLTRSGIGELVWDMNFEDESNVIEVYISRLRNKLHKGFDKPLIHTVAGCGYILSAERNSPL